MRTSDRARDQQRGDDGDTLIEVAIAVLIIAVATVAIVAGLGTLAKAISVHRSASTEEAILRSFSEVLIKPPDGNADSAIGYSTACPSSYGVPSWFTVPSGYTISTSVKIWDGSTQTLSSGGSYDPPSFVASPSPCYDHGLQQVTITVTQTSTGRTQSMTVLKAELT